MDLFSFARGDRDPELAADLAEARKAEATARSLQAELLEQQRRTDRIALACAALMEILQERVGISDEELEERMRAIDLRDGSEDGRITERPTQCRTFPFWRETLRSREKWENLAEFCPGIDKGPRQSLEVIREQLAQRKLVGW